MFGKRLAVGGNGFAADDLLDLAAPRQIVRLARLFDVFGEKLLFIFCRHTVERTVGSQNASSGIAGIQHLPVFRIPNDIFDLVDHDRVDVAILVANLIINVIRGDELIDAQNIVGHVLLLAADRRILLEFVGEFLRLAACRAEQPLRGSLVLQPEMRRREVQDAAAVGSSVLRCLEDVILRREEDGIIIVLRHGEGQKFPLRPGRHNGACRADILHKSLVRVVEVDRDDDSIRAVQLVIVCIALDGRIIHRQQIAVFAERKRLHHIRLIQRAERPPVGELEIAPLQILALQRV